MNKIQFVSIHASVLVALAYTAQAAAVPVDPSTTVTATMDGGIAKTGNTWYELGVNLAAATTGLKTGLVVGQADPLSTFLFQPAAGLNTLLLDSAATSGTLTFKSPLTFSGFAIAGSSGNGAGTIKPTLHFADGSSDVLANGTVGDWFNNSPRIETVAGRINVPANSFGNVGADNPRVLSISYSLSAADSSKAISSISLDWTGGANTHTAIFGVSGDFTGIGHYSAIPLAGSSFNRDTIVGVAEVAVVPEPGTVALLGVGALGLMLVSRRGRS